MTGLPRCEGQGAAAVLARVCNPPPPSPCKPLWRTPPPPARTMPCRNNSGCCFRCFWNFTVADMSLASGNDFDCIQQPPVGNKRRIRQPPVEIWVAFGGLKQRKHRSLRSISRRLWRATGSEICDHPPPWQGEEQLDTATPNEEEFAASYCLDELCSDTMGTTAASGSLWQRFSRPPAQSCPRIGRPSVCWR